VATSITGWKADVLGVERADAVATRPLGPEEGAVGGVQELSDAGGVHGVGGHAGRAGERRAGHGQRGEVPAAALGQPDGGRLVRVRERDRELLAADAGHEAGVADRPRQRLGGDLQHAVTLGVAEGVVERLEVVEVEHDDADRRIVRGGPRHGAVHALLERAVVAKARERVGGGERLEIRALPRQPPQREPEPDDDRQQREADQRDGDRVEVAERLVDDEAERGDGEGDRQRHPRGRRRVAGRRHRAPGRPPAPRRRRRRSSPPARTRRRVRTRRRAASRRRPT
jgi:hypothetical protein